MFERLIAEKKYNNDSSNSKNHNFSNFIDFIDLLNNVDKFSDQHAREKNIEDLPRWFF